ncbi:hypothetical protein SELMODRAFT_106485 [Selaginella moellendorffii]|uniref:Uncharacterized protein n=1 Tax=Selaginella moellendorffii TaxID=88036 RepID=D8S1D5_SELML|nr:short-chain dehydrogenase TIC 32, chloroplastic [Selaginella moellendorffii]EFJ21828.1 hypothetical protein SELMODRAFT_106485 [Selaginella moellendorffii]|eukprot:XP_002977219.1 short-chain dehydrogenase TIC 32, chloroplastic [Selaginella moellendorffii]
MGKRSGYGAHSTAEEVAQGIDAKNLTAIVTGGASGIGAEVVRILAKQGARVVIAARNKEAAERARAAMEKELPGASVQCMELDLASLASVRGFVEDFKKSGLPLNLLINNAGLMFCPFSLTADGVESQFATNHLGHFLLTNLLLDTMKETAAKSGIQGRIVNLSSVAHATVGYKEGIRDLDAINDRGSYDSKKAYGQSKLANILHANSLTAMFQREKINITANAVHPGLIGTPLWRHSAAMKLFVKIIYAGKWKSVEQGAATTIYAAIHPDMADVSGRYLADCQEAKPSKKALDPQLGKKLWDISELLVSRASA